MTAAGGNAARRSPRRSGAAQVEWILIFVGFVVPMVMVIRILLSTLAVHYGMVSFLETLPYP